MKRKEKEKNGGEDDRSAQLCLAQTRGHSVCVWADPNLNQIWWTNGSVWPKTQTKIEMDRPAGLAFLSGGHKRTMFIRLGRALDMPLGHLQRADPNDHPRSERIRADKTHGLAGRPKQTSYPNAFACTHSGLRFGPKVHRSRQPTRPFARPHCPPRAQPIEAPSHSSTPPLCCPAARAPPPFRHRRCHGHRRCPLAAPTTKK
jgi:hypothetical protein